MDVRRLRHLVKLTGPGSRDSQLRHEDLQQSIFFGRIRRVDVGAASRWRICPAPPRNRNLHGGIDMAYSFVCADTGADCPGSFKSEGKEELFAHLGVHAEHAHPEMVGNAEMAAAIPALIKQV